MYKYFENNTHVIVVFKNDGIEAHNSERHYFFPWGSLNNINSSIGVLTFTGRIGNETRVMNYAYHSAESAEIKKMIAYTKEQMKTAPKKDGVVLKRTKPEPRPLEYFKSCKDCGHVYTYDSYDLDREGLTYIKCPKCDSSNLEEITQKAFEEATFDPKKDKKEKNQEKGKAIVMILVAVGIAVAILSGGKSSGGTKWSDLSDQEKANAKWAHEVNEYLKNNK